MIWGGTLRSKLWVWTDHGMGAAGVQNEGSLGPETIQTMILKSHHEPWTCASGLAVSVHPHALLSLGCPLSDHSVDCEK